MNSFEENDMMLQQGTLLQSKYRIDAKLGSGGFGNTYVATHLGLENVVAIKEFFMKGINHRDTDGSTVRVSNDLNNEVFTTQKRKFKKEAQRLFALSNPHIVRVFDMFEANNTVYYVMDYIKGESLRGLMKLNEKPFTEPQVMNVLLQMIEAVEYIHSNSILHMDIKPGNILMDKMGKCTLIDFGSSKHVETQDTVTSQALSYTPGYAPPEQMNGTMRRWGVWTDFYALGATLYNLLTDRKPPCVDDIMNDGRECFHFFYFPISANFREMIVWMMQPNIAHRPQNINAIKNYIRYSLPIQPEPLLFPEFYDKENTDTLYNRQVQQPYAYDKDIENNPNNNTNQETDNLDDNDDIIAIEETEDYVDDSNHLQNGKDEMSDNNVMDIGKMDDHEKEDEEEINEAPEDEIKKDEEVNEESEEPDEEKETLEEEKVVENEDSAEIKEDEEEENENAEDEIKKDEEVNEESEELDEEKDMLDEEKVVENEDSAEIKDSAVEENENAEDEIKKDEEVDEESEVSDEEKEAPEDADKEEKENVDEEDTGSEKSTEKKNASKFKLYVGVLLVAALIIGIVLFFTSKGDNTTNDKGAANIDSTAVIVTDPLQNDSMNIVVDKPEESDADSASVTAVDDNDDSEQDDGSSSHHHHGRSTKNEKPTDLPTQHNTNTSSQSGSHHHSSNNEQQKTKLSEQSRTHNNGSGNNQHQQSSSQTQSEKPKPTRTQGNVLLNSNSRSQGSSGKPRENTNTTRTSGRSLMYHPRIESDFRE